MVSTLKFASAAALGLFALGPALAVDAAAAPAPHVIGPVHADNGSSSGGGGSGSGGNSNTNGSGGSSNNVGGGGNSGDAHAGAAGSGGSKHG